MTFRVLHYAQDEKQVPLAQGLFEEALPGQNSFRIHSEAEGLRHVRAAANVVQVGRGYFGSAEAAADLERCDCLVVHGMTRFYVPAVLRAPDRVRVVWSGWGFDYCDLLEARLGPLVLPQTRRLARGTMTLDRLRYLASVRAPLAKLGRGLLRAVREARPRPHPLVAVAPRIDAFSVVPGEVELVRGALPQLQARHQWIVYATTEDTLAVGPPSMDGPDLLVGNSAVATNNHAEAFEALARLDLAGRRIVVPLNYGSPAYADAVCRLGRRRFGAAFVPLRRFMPLAEYHEVQKNCGTVIMNHVRQQAVGTLCTVLYKGAKVFMRPESPVFNYFAGLGVAVGSIAGLEADAALAPLAPAQRQHNRERLGALLARSAAVARIRELRDVPRRGAA